MTDSDDDLAEAIDDLAETIDDLRTEFEPRRRRPPLRPPTPRELLRVTDEIAIPALVAILEANVRALRTFQRALKVLRRERQVRDQTDAVTDRTRERAADLRTTTLDQLDGVLAELQRAVDGGTPDDRRAAELLEDARALRDDIDRRLESVAGNREDESSRDGSDHARGEPIPIDDEPDDQDDPASVDVDAELETLRDQYGPDETDADGDEGGDDVRDENSGVGGDEDDDEGEGEGDQ